MKVKVKDLTEQVKKMLETYAECDVTSVVMDVTFVSDDYESLDQPEGQIKIEFGESFKTEGN